MDFAGMGVNLVINVTNASASVLSGEYGPPYPFINTGVIDGVRSDGHPIGYGCGDAKTDAYVPDRIGSINLLPACIAHDQCYDVGTTTPKVVCDTNFGKDVYSACVSEGYSDFVCSALSGVYQGAVELWGDAAYGGY